MTDNYSILTHLSADEVTQVMNKNLGKTSFWEFIKKVQFEGKVENNQIKLDTIQMPYVRVRGEISSNHGGTILKLKIHTDDHATSAYLFLKAILIIIVSLVSLLTIIYFPKSFLSYLLILIYSLLGFIAFKAIKFWLKFFENIEDDDTSHIANEIKKMVKGKYA